MKNFKCEKCKLNLSGQNCKSNRCGLCCIDYSCHGHSRSRVWLKNKANESVENSDAMSLEIHEMEVEKPKTRKYNRESSDYDCHSGIEYNEEGEIIDELMEKIREILISLSEVYYKLHLRRCDNCDDYMCSDCTKTVTTRCQNFDCFYCRSGHCFNTHHNKYCENCYLDFVIECTKCNSYEDENNDCCDVATKNKMQSM